MICDNCGTPASDAARFCRRCGAALTESAHVDLELPTADPGWGRGNTILVAALGLSLALLASGAVWFYMEKRGAEADKVRLLALAQAKQHAEAKMQADVRAARKRAEEAEQALIDAEQQVALAGKQQEAARRYAEAVAKADARTKADKAMREAQSKRQAAERTMQEAQERRRAEEAAMAAAQAKPAPPPPPPPAPKVVAQAPPPSPPSLCKPLTNIISRGFCETRECIKPEYVNSEYCRAIRARSSTAVQPAQP